MTSSARIIANARAFIARAVDRERNNVVLPAVGAGVVVGGKLAVTHTSGVRKHGTNEAVRDDDLFHLGSISKPVTGYLLARLVSKKKLDWSDTLGTAFPELLDDVDKDWREHYRKTTIAELMTHVSGFDYAPRNESEQVYGAIDPQTDEGLIKKRLLYTALALADRPFDGDGWTTLSNGKRQKYGGGCIVATAMAEKKTGKGYAQLLQTEVFDRLRMTRTGFSRMSALGEVTGPWQHKRTDGEIKSSAQPDKSNVHYVHGPAGNVLCSMDSFARFVDAVLTNHNPVGKAGPHLRPSVWKRYVTPDSGMNCSVGGWFGDETAVAHDGSNLWNYSSAQLDLTRKVGGFSFANIWSKTADGKEPVNAAMGRIAGELKAFAACFELAEYMHQAVPFDELSPSADSVWDGTGTYDPRLVNDGWFSTRWASKSATPTLTLQSSSTRPIRGFALGQVFENRIVDFDVEILPSTRGGSPTMLTGSALAPHVRRSDNGLVLAVSLPEPVEARGIAIHVKSSSSTPTVAMAMLLQWKPARVRDFAFDAEGRLTIVDTANQVFSAAKAIASGPIALGTDTAGVAFSVRRGGGQVYLIGSDSKVWRGGAHGWTPVPSSPIVKRIAADAGDGDLWAIDDHDRIRHFDVATNAWTEHPGGGLGKDICVDQGKPRIVGMDDTVYVGNTSGWSQLAGTSPKLSRVAIDAESDRLWALDVGRRIFSYDKLAKTWTEHPGGGLGKRIGVHAGKPYLVGTDDGLWVTAGNSGWKKLEVLS